MKKEILRRFEWQLNEWLKDLLNHAGSSISDLSSIEVQSPETLDLATMESNRSLAIRLRDREHLLIRKILQSLRDIEEGAYGICDACGEPIAVERLKARPIARYCIACKTDMEKRERLTGG